MGCENCTNNHHQGAITLHPIEVHLPMSVRRDFIDMLDFTGMIIREYCMNNEPSDVQDKILYYYNTIFGFQSDDVNIARRVLKKVKFEYDNKAYIPIWKDEEAKIEDTNTATTEETISEVPAEKAKPKRNSKKV